MRVVVIGGSGHIGTYLVPRLVEAGYDVISISRGKREPYQPHSVWQSVRQVVMDRKEEEAMGTFGRRVQGLKPDIVIDLISFTLESTQQLVESLRGRIQHFLHCGTIWVHGYSEQVPSVEHQVRRPFGEYGKQKAEIESYLLHEARLRQFPATVLHPGHIVGTGWIPINPAGNLNPQVFTKLARGEKVTLPNFGMETLHHVHADDVAQAFVQSIRHWSQAVGESFHVVSPFALTLRGYAEAVASWFNRDAQLSFLPWNEWKKTVSERDAAVTFDHITHSPNCSISKAQRLMEYQPRYTSLEAVRESLNWLINQKVIEV